MTGSPTWLARYAAPNPPAGRGRRAVRDRSQAVALVCGLLLVLSVGSPTLAVAGRADVIAEEALACTARVVAAGDMSSLPANRATGLLAQRLQPQVVAVLGGLAYPNGSRSDVLPAYDPTGCYAYKVGCGWRGYALNSEVGIADQASWLRADLAAHPGVNVLAYWHKPRYSSGTHHGSDPAMQPLWDALAGGPGGRAQRARAPLRTLPR